MKKILQHLKRSLANFDLINDIQCPNEDYHYFMTLFLAAYDIAFPLKIISITKKIHTKSGKKW